MRWKDNQVIMERSEKVKQSNNNMDTAIIREHKAHKGDMRSRGARLGDQSVGDGSARSARP